MKKKNFLWLLAIAYISLFGNCKKNTLTLSNPEFPNNTGTWWKYKVYDSVYNRLDTVTINVVGNTKLVDGIEVSIWAIKSLINGVDTNYVSNKSDGIRIYPFNTRNAPIIKRYLFPLMVGDKWVTGNILDTNRVTLQGSITTLAGTFAGFRINRDVNFPPGYNPVKEAEWFVQNIGMVSRQYFEIGPGYMRNKKWELVNYSIK